MATALQQSATLVPWRCSERSGRRKASRWLACVVVVLASPVAAQTVVNGDTIRMKGVTYQLYGIDAAEIRQACADGWAAGREAVDYLRGLVQDRGVECQAVAKNRHGRTVAVCTADGDDLAAEMVSAGMAWAFTRYSNDYIDEEAQANIDRLGVHDHDCMPAWDWRARQERRALKVD